MEKIITLIIIVTLMIILCIKCQLNQISFPQLTSDQKKVFQKYVSQIKKASRDSNDYSSLPSLLQNKDILAMYYYTNYPVNNYINNFPNFDQFRVVIKVH